MPSIASFASDAKNRVGVGLTRNGLLRLGPGFRARKRVQQARPCQRMYSPQFEADMTCECGCGENPTRGNFCPGHDQRLRSLLEKRVGGLIALRTLVESAERLATNEISSEEHASKVRSILKGGG